MKRAWTKKVKSLPSFAILKNALEKQFQPQRQVKRRVFRTSGAVIGLTVSIGTPNLLLTQAAQVPERIGSQSAPINDSAASEMGQNAPVIAPDAIQPVPIVKLSTTIAPFEYHSPQKQPAKIANPSNQQSVRAENKINTPKVIFTPQLQPSNAASCC